MVGVIMRHLKTLTVNTLVIAGIMVNSSSLAAFTRAPQATTTNSVISCPYNHICEGDLTLFSWMSTAKALPLFHRAKYRGAEFYVSLVDKPNFPDDYRLVKKGDSHFRSIWYRTIIPNLKYYFVVVINYSFDSDPADINHIDPIDFYYFFKSYDHSGSPSASYLKHSLMMDPRQGVLSDTEADSMGLPKTPECLANYDTHYICSHQIVHLFWNNDRGLGNHGKKVVAGVRLEANGKTVAYGGADMNQAFYTVPAANYTNQPITFKLHYQVHDPGTPLPLSSENSQPLTMKFSPNYAGWCNKVHDEGGASFPWCHRN